MTNRSRWLLIASAVVTLAVAAACGSNSTAADDVPPLNATTFLAFGDGLTAGVGLPDAACPSTPTTIGAPLSSPSLAFKRFRIGGTLEAREGLSYPTLLATLLKNRHPDQLIKVINAGQPDEEVTAGVARFPTALQDANHPHAVLLLEGISDINLHGAGTLDAMAGAYRAMILAARQMGAEVIVSTILPERRGACRAYDWLDGVNDIVTVNARLRAVALQEGASVIDLYSVFEPRVNTLLGPDGLYPTDPGYQVMADSFFGVIEKLFERD